MTKDNQDKKKIKDLEREIIDITEKSMGILIQRRYLESILDRTMKKFSISLRISDHAINLLTKIKDRYPYIWGECVTNADEEQISLLVKEAMKIDEKK